MNHPLAQLTIYALFPALLPGIASAQDTSFTLEGRVSGYAQAVGLEKTDLVPDPTGSGYKDTKFGADAVVQMRGDFDAGTVRGQIRLAYEDEETAVFVDEAYVEIGIGEASFAFAGRRILSYGQSYGLNPADIFADPLRENRVFPSAKSRNDVEGVDMVGVDLLFENGGSLTALYAPGFDHRDNGNEEDFVLLRYAGFAADGTLDYGLSVFSGDRPGIGISGSYGVGDASVIYLDATFRQGQEKATVTGLNGVGLPVIATGDDQAITGIVTLGFGHSFSNGLSLNAEFTHDSGGYSDAEWGEIDTAINPMTGLAPALKGAAMGQLNGLLNHYTLRQNYGFLRLSHENVLGSNILAELTVLHGFDDQSGSAGLRFEMPLGETFTAGIMATKSYGANNSEFNLRPKTGTLSIYTTARF